MELNTTTAALELDPSTAAPQRTGIILRVLRSRIALLIAFNVVFIVLVSAIAPDFLRLDNFRVIIDGMALEAVVAATMALLLAAGRFDLSVDGVAALSAIVCGDLMLSGLPIVLAIAIGIGLGVSIGSVNGLLIEHLGFNPIVISLATWWITGGIAYGVTNGYAPHAFPSTFATLGQRQVWGFQVGDFYAFFLVGIIGIVFKFTKFGYHLLATGGDRESARLKGVRVERVGIILYAMSGAAAAFVGIAFAMRLDSAQPNAVDGMALNVIAAAVIGGAGLAGGYASVTGAVLGLFLLAMLTNAAIFVGVSPLWQKAISGSVLVIAVALDAMREGGRGRNILIAAMRAFRADDDGERRVTPEPF